MNISDIENIKINKKKDPHNPNVTIITINVTIF